MWERFAACAAIACGRGDALHGLVLLGGDVLECCVQHGTPCCVTFLTYPGNPVSQMPHGDPAQLMLSPSVPSTHTQLDPAPLAVWSAPSQKALEEAVAVEAARATPMSVSLSGAAPFGACNAMVTTIVCVGGGRRAWGGGGVGVD